MPEQGERGEEIRANKEQDRERERDVYSRFQISRLAGRLGLLLGHERLTGEYTDFSFRFHISQQ
jgi:hypothetical protein